jgi:hypothetical protein
MQSSVAVGECQTMTATPPLPCSGCSRRLLSWMTSLMCYSAARTTQSTIVSSQLLYYINNILYVPHIRKRSSSRFLSCDGPGLRVLIGGEGVVLATKCFLLRSQAPFWRAYVALLARPSLQDVSRSLACVKSGLELQVRATFALLSKKHSVYNPQQGAVKKSWGGLNALVARPPTTYTIMATSHHCRRLRARVDVALAGRSCH